MFPDISVKEIGFLDLYSRTGPAEPLVNCIRKGGDAGDASIRRPVVVRVVSAATCQCDEPERHQEILKIQ